MIATTQPAVAPYYEHDGITLYHGDARLILPTLAPAAVAVTDPPFNSVNLRDNSGDFRFARTLHKGSADDAPVDPDWLADTLATKVSSAYVFCGPEQFSTYCRAFTRARMTFRTAFWVKTNPSPFNGEHFWLSAIELCVFARQSGATFTRHCVPPVWRGPTIRDAAHPTPKPDWLIAELIAASSRPGDVVIDPYVGIGTTLWVAKGLGRRAVGIEIEERYCEVAATRLAQSVLPFVDVDGLERAGAREVAVRAQRSLLALAEVS